MNDDTESFRKRALEHITVPKELNDLIKITSPQAWIFLSAVTIIIIALIFWLFFGTVISRVEGKGILFAESGSLVNVVTPEPGGYVTKLYVSSGVKVKKGQVIAEFNNPKIKNEIAATQEYIKKLRKSYQDLSKTSKSMIQEKTKHLDEKTQELIETIDVSKKKLAELKRLLDIKTKVLKKGIITRINWAETYLMHSDLLKEISKHENELTNMKLEKVNVLDTWRERLRKLQLTINEQVHNLAKLRAQQQALKSVKSPGAGTVIGIHAAVGDYLDKSKVIINLATRKEGLEAIVFVKALDGKRIKPGMRVKVTPTVIKKAEFGSIVGQVFTVSSYPSTEASMLFVLRNKTLVKDFLKHGPVITTRILLVKDPTTYSGYEWTSSKGPQQVISPGTLVNVGIITKKQSPISLIVPALKNLFK